MLWKAAFLVALLTAFPPAVHSKADSEADSEAGSKPLGVPTVRKSDYGGYFSLLGRMSVRSKVDDVCFCLQIRGACAVSISGF